MRRNSDPWLRFYVRTLNNPKAQRLPGNIFKGWVNLLCLAKETEGHLPPVEDVSFRLRLTPSKAKSLLNTLRSNGLIDGYKMHDWDEMQKPSDSSTERVQRHRERNKEQACNVPSNVSETAQSREDKSREDKSREEPPLPPVGESVYPDFFIAFWNSYPKGRRVGKQAALKAWKKLKPSTDLSKTIIKAITRQSENGHFKGDKGQDFVPLPTTWLNQGRWDDEPRSPTPPPKPSQQFRPPPTTDPATEAAYAKRREEFQRTQKQNRDRMLIEEPETLPPPKTDFKAAKEGLEAIRQRMKI